MKLYVNLFLILCCTTSIFGGGTDYNPFAGSKTLALNGMYYAGTDNAFSFNPSAIIDLEGFNISLSVIDKIGQQEFASPLNGLRRSYSEDKFNFSGALSWKYNALALALSYYPVVDFHVSWPYTVLRERNNTKTVRAFDLLSSTQITVISPSAAYDLGFLTIGLSANIYMMKFKSDFPIMNESWFSGTGELGYQFRYEEDGMGYGGTIGALMQLGDDLRLGAMVKTPVKIDLSGTGISNMFAELDSAATETDLGGTFEIPLTIGGGVLFNLSPALTLNADASYLFWGSTEKVFDYEIQNNAWTNRLNNTDAITGINAETITLNLENSFSAGIGIEYLPGGAVHYRAGYRYSKSPYSAETYNMLLPAVDTHDFSFGIGYFEEKYSIDLTLLYSAGLSKSISNTTVPVNSGKYKSRTVVPALTLSYKL